MKQIFVLSKENIGLAKAEALSLAKPQEYELIGNLLIAEAKKDFSRRLGLTHSAYMFLFRCREEELPEKIMAYDWNRIYRKNFCVRVHGSRKFSEREISTMVWKQLENPKVKLSGSGTRIKFFFEGGMVIAGLFLYDADKSQLKRKAHMRPKLHPTSLHPSLAKACINLTGLEKGTVLDPFCGSGGILIEAGLMGLNAVGYDIDDEQLKRAEINLKHYGLKNCRLEKKDATALESKADAVVTDPPYGKGSRGKNLEKLYMDFLWSARKITGNMVVIFPDFIDYRQIIEKSGWKIKGEFRVYIHKSLTRIILKLI